MADNNNKRSTTGRLGIQRYAASIQNNMDALYQRTYYSSPQLNNDLKGISKDISDNIERITNHNMDTVGMPNISKLYARLDAGGKSFSNGFMQNVSDLFEGSAMQDDFYTSFMENKYLKDGDVEIDTVCKYMPKLEEALEAKKDNVLSADHFSKDYISVTGGAKQGEEVTFDRRISEIKKSYDLLNVIDKAYGNAAKYGEQFIYTIPYKKALAKLLATKADTIVPSEVHEDALLESVNHIESAGKRTYAMFNFKGNKMSIVEDAGEGIKSVSESATYSSFTEDKSGAVKETINNLLSQDEEFTVFVECNKSGVIDSLVKNKLIAETKKRQINEMALFTENGSINRFGESLTEDVGDLSMPDSLGNLSFEGMPETPEKFRSKSAKKIKDYTSDVPGVDGLIPLNKGAEDYENKYKITSPGCIVKLIEERSQVIPIYIDDMCMGYYYLEFRANDSMETLNGFKNIMNDPLTNMKANGRTINSVTSLHQEEMIKYLAGQLSQYIDKNFINANHDLRKEIYMVLKYNDLFNKQSVDQIKITFVAPQDMIHVHFKLDPITHRGISDLEKAMIPAKIFSSLYVTNSLQLLTRSSDKRVYYVKQSVDSNIAKNLLNTIQQIKQSNFGIRHFQNINNVLNITGRFNDYVIPTNQSGEAPIQFDVMPGMQVEVKTEFMTMLEEMAVNSTDVPIELIQARQSIDYATQLSMSNSKFLRKVYSRQGQFQVFISSLITKIYNTEYEENQELDVTLPPPTFLNTVNTNQVITNTKEFVDSIVEIDTANEDDDAFKSIYRKDLLEHYLGTYIDLSKNKVIFDKAKIKAAIAKNDKTGTVDNDSEY